MADATAPAAYNPLYVTSAIAAGLVVIATFLHFFLPMQFIFSYPYTLVGAPLLLMGVWVVASAKLEFENAQTPMRFGAPQRLVTSGPYAKSRNPMYFGGLATLLGIAMLLGSFSALIAPIGFFLYLHYFIIPKEEEVMHKKFGTEYDAYTKKVNRWI